MWPAARPWEGKGKATEGWRAGRRDGRMEGGMEGGMASPPSPAAAFYHLSHRGEPICYRYIQRQADGDMGHTATAEARNKTNPPCLLSV
jgi:hypothetical protein